MSRCKWGRPRGGSSPARCRPGAAAAGRGAAWYAGSVLLPPRLEPSVRLLRSCGLPSAIYVIGFGSNSTVVMFIYKRCPRDSFGVLSVVFLAFSKPGFVVSRLILGASGRRTPGGRTGVRTGPAHPRRGKTAVVLPEISSSILIF